MNKLLALFTLIGWSVSMQAQDLVAVEDSIAKYFNQLAKSQNDQVAEELCAKMEVFFEESFQYTGVFDYPFESLKMMKAISSDHHIRIINWNLPYQDGSFKYFCFVLEEDPKEKTVRWFKLEDHLREGEKLESKYLNADKWLGALYYEIIPIKEKKRQKVSNKYVLLGWDGKDDLTTRKIIDVLEITGNKVRLGDGIFELPQGTKKRMIYEYSNDVSASVKYYTKENVIVMDHLSPKSSATVGIYADYGPDGTYDCFEFEKGKFVLKENVDVTKYIESDNRPYVIPKK